MKSPYARPSVLRDVESCSEAIYGCHNKSESIHVMHEIPK